MPAGVGKEREGLKLTDRARKGESTVKYARARERASAYIYV